MESEEMQKPDILDASVKSESETGMNGKACQEHGGPETTDVPNVSEPLADTGDKARRENDEPDMRDAGGKKPPSNPDLYTEDGKPKYRGLYRYVHVSERTLNIVIVVGLILIVLVVLFGVSKGGYTITFDSKGGTDVESQERRYGETVEEPEPPTREGYVFDGWYVDEDCTMPWNFEADTVENTMSLYAGWTAAP